MGDSKNWGFVRGLVVVVAVSLAMVGRAQDASTGSISGTITDASGAVIESKLDPGRGPVVTVLIQRGTNHAWAAHGGPALFLAVLIDRALVGG